MKVAIIPARGGSTRIPGKNKRLFHGMPIICYSIIAAKKSGCFDRICVSTDDPEIAAIAMAGGAWAIYRQDGFCKDEVGTQEVLTQCAALFPADLICGIYPTCPLMLPDEIVRGCRMLVEKNAHFAFAVGTDPLRDAGMFYWGTQKAFLERKELISAQSIMIPIQEKYVCDINTEDDWQRAEKMYADLHGK